MAGAQAASSLGIGMFGMAMMLPNLGFQASGTPGGSLPVGSIAGGGLPTNTAITTLPLSLALVPLGLMAVAVFPPFARFVPKLYIPSTIKNTIKKRCSLQSIGLIRYVGWFLAD